MYALKSLAAFAALAAAQSVTIQDDPGLLTEPRTAGPEPELIHLYYDQWPTGKNGRGSVLACPC